MWQEYSPFLFQHRQTIAIVASSILVGISVEKWLNKRHALGSRRDEIKVRKLAAQEAQSAADTFTDNGDEDDDPPDENQLPKIVYQYIRPTSDQCADRSAKFYDLMNQRRSVRNISSLPVSRQVIDNIVRTAGDLMIRVLVIVQIFTLTTILKKREAFYYLPMHKCLGVLT